MPYFYNENINLLFVHIPKTGGTSVEHYFSHKYKIPLNYKSLWSFNIEDMNKLKSKSSLQHLTLNQIYKYSNEKLININFNNLKIITIIRNPYERIISDLLWYSLININSTKKEVFNVINNYIKSTKYDNHNIPQYLFITDENKKIYDNIKIFCTSSLNHDMINEGYSDFNMKVNSNNKNVDYYDYLNKDSINLINSFYHDDFVLFKFNKLT